MVERTRLLREKFKKRKKTGGKVNENYIEIQGESKNVQITNVNKKKAGFNDFTNIVFIKAVWKLNDIYKRLFTVQIMAIVHCCSFNRSTFA